MLLPVTRHGLELVVTRKVKSEPAVTAYERVEVVHVVAKKTVSPGPGLPEDQAKRVRAAMVKLRQELPTDAALARDLSIDPATVGRVLHDKGCASYKVALCVARKLGVDVGRLLDGSAT